jgi:hypothetical protein
MCPFLSAAPNASVRKFAGNNNLTGRPKCEAEPIRLITQLSVPFDRQAAGIDLNPLHGLVARKVSRDELKSPCVRAAMQP